MKIYQNIELVVSTILFLFFFGYFRPMITNNKINSYDIIITSILFFIWYYLTLFILNLSNIKKINII
jgi:hypothetical protein